MLETEISPEEIQHYQARTKDLFGRYHDTAWNSMQKWIKSGDYKSVESTFRQLEADLEKAETDTDEEEARLTLIDLIRNT